MPELILPCGHKEYVCTTISVEMYRRYTEIMERNDSDSIRDAFEANTKILMTVFGARQQEVEEADPEDVLSAVKEIFLRNIQKQRRRSKTGFQKFRKNRMQHKTGGKRNGSS